jgi:hypothetical protein
MAQKEHNIITPNGRSGLPVRIHEPYWRTLDRGRSLGFRKIAADRGTWIARMRPEDGGAKYEYKPLDDVSPAFDYTQAEAAAKKWFADRVAGVKSGVVDTVGDACRSYVEERRRSKSEECANDAAARFERSVYGRKEGERDKAKAIDANGISRVALAKLRAERIRRMA